MGTGQRPDDKLRVVLDTNAIVSGLNFSGNEFRVLELDISGRVQMYLSPFILGEVERVLQRKFGWEVSTARDAIRAIRQWAVVVVPTDMVTTVERDDDDNRVLECCLESSAHYLITGDKRDLLPLEQFHETTIVNAADFLRVFDASSLDP